MNYIKSLLCISFGELFAVTTPHLTLAFLHWNFKLLRKNDLCMYVRLTLFVYLKILVSFRIHKYVNKEEEWFNIYKKLRLNFLVKYKIMIVTHLCSNTLEQKIKFYLQFIYPLLYAPKQICWSSTNDSFF